MKRFILTPPFLFTLNHPSPCRHGGCRGFNQPAYQRGRTLPHKQLIVATDRGIFYKMQQAVPEKELLEAPNGRRGRDVSQLRALPVDGDERSESDCRRAGDGRRRA